MESILAAFLAPFLLVEVQPYLDKSKGVLEIEQERKLKVKMKVTLVSRVDCSKEAEQQP